MIRRQADFRYDLEFGRVGEDKFADMITALRDGHNRVEIKHKRLGDAVFYVEVENKRNGEWVPSGLTTTEADYLAYVCPNDVMVVLPVWTWRAVVARIAADPRRAKSETKIPTSVPTRGYNVHIGDLWDGVLVNPLDLL